MTIQAGRIGTVADHPNVYLLTGGLLGIGLLYDLWTLNGQVSEINRRDTLVGR